MAVAPWEQPEFFAAKLRAAFKVLQSWPRP
jgi:hypothetical protein